MDEERDNRVAFTPDDDNEEAEAAIEWTIRSASTPGELEVVLNQLAAEGWEVWSIYDRMVEFVVVAFTEE